MTTKASVIIPTFNGGDLLLEVCKKLLVQDYKDSWEIIIIDSESSDDSINQIQELFNNSKIPFKLITINKIDFQHGKTRNQAIKQSSGENILLLTQDSVPVRDDWLSTMVKAFEDKSIAGVFGRHIAHENHPKLIQRDLDLHFESMNELPIRKINDWNEYENNISLRQTLHFFSNNNSGLRRTVWEEIPFPNVDFGEDQTWAKKVIEAGFCLAYQNDSVVHHSHNFSVKEWHKRCKIEINYFKRNFNYDLHISHRKAFQKSLLGIRKDIQFLVKNYCLNFYDYVFCIKKNLVINFSHTLKSKPNPSHVCPYDQHVWTFSSKNIWLFNDSEIRTSKKTLLNYIESHTPWFADIDPITEMALATKKIVSSSKEKGIIIDNDDNDECNLNKIRRKISDDPELADVINFPIVVPDKSIHRMQHSNYWIGDFYSANLVLNVLHEAGIKLKENHEYLDFGCSSGSLLRVMKWFFPSANWHGTDPVENSINWACKNLTGISFSINKENPPMNLLDSSMNGVISISVWSHFGEKSGRLWLNEMHRILKPGGWILFTTHGLRSIYHYAKNIEKEPARWCAIFDALLTNDFVFEQTWMLEDDAGNSARDWGSSYIKLSWILQCTANKFQLLLYKRGINQKNQDVYLLRKT